MKNHESFEAELSEGEHAVILKLGGISILKDTVSAGENDWTLSYEQYAANFVLSESKPFYGKHL